MPCDDEHTTKNRSIRISGARPAARGRRDLDFDSVLRLRIVGAGGGGGAVEDEDEDEEWDRCGSRQEEGTAVLGVVLIFWDSVRSSPSNVENRSQEHKRQARSAFWTYFECMASESGHRQCDKSIQAKEL